MKVGLIGEKLGHSFSKEIHEQLTNYTYDLIELSQDEFHRFIKEKNFDAINVTIPYKEKIIPYLDEIDKKGMKVGAINAVKRVDGKLIGTNTDYDGLKLMIEHHFNLENEIVLICGRGATSKTAMAVVKDMKPKEIVQVSRTPKNDMISYEQLKNRKDITYILDTTSVGMSPNINQSVVDVNDFPNLKGVIDVVYNPLCTKICYEARQRGIQAVTGLDMLVGQAIVAISFFLNKEMDLRHIQSISKKIYEEKVNKIYFEKRENVDYIEITSSNQVKDVACMQGKHLLVQCDLKKEEWKMLLLNGVVIK